MTRREWIGSCGVAALAQRRAKPNIVLILADDLGFGDLSCYGQKLFSTPNIDALAAGGTRFTSAYAGSTVCAPSRCALMTGYHTGHGRIRGNGVNETVLRADDIVIPELLKTAGYRTGLFGKWALGQLGYPGYPTKKGWDEWFGYFSQLHAHNYYPEMLLHNDSFVDLKGNTGKRRSDYAPDVIHDYALKWLDRQSARDPFFLFYNSTIPHTNNEMGRDTGNGQEVPEDAPYSAKPWPQVEKNFAAMVSRLDRLVGSIVERLKKFDNTLIIFTSDNGAHKEGGHNADFFHSSGPLRGTKRDLYEGGIRVPAIVNWPGQVPAGKTNDIPWVFYDMMPTLCEVAGVGVPKGIDGLPALGSWMGRPTGTHDVFYWEFHEGGFSQAIRHGNWKAVKLKNGAIELYDLAKDLGETTNVASSNPVIVREMRTRFQTERSESPDWPVG